MNEFSIQLRLIAAQCKADSLSRRLIASKFAPLLTNVSTTFSLPSEISSKFHELCIKIIIRNINSMPTVESG